MPGHICFLEAEAHPPAALPETVPPYPLTWTTDTLQERDFRYPLDAACRAELAAVGASLARDPLPALVLEPEMFELPACAAFMARVRAGLDGGSGVALLEGFPLEELTLEQATGVYWVLASLLGRPVAVKWNGLMVYDVKDIGLAPGNGVRASLTNAELGFHTDSQFAHCPPEYITLLCINPALEGGQSALVNWHAVYDALRREDPHLAARGFRHFLFDRQREHPPGAPEVMSRPVFKLVGDRLAVCYYARVIRDGYALAGETMDGETSAFLDAVERLVADPALRRDFHFERGQIQIINNAFIGHARTNFRDDPARPRHLLRLWLRNHGRIGFDG